jgi:hypothetical protein
MRSHFHFDVLIVLPQDALSAAAGVGRKWGRNREWKLRSDHRDDVVMTSCALFPFLLEFYCVLFLCNFGVFTVWQFLLLVRSLKMTQITAYNFVTVFCVTV